MGRVDVVIATIAAAVAAASSPALADGQIGRVGASVGVDAGHGAGSTVHLGISAGVMATSRLAFMLEGERVTPRGDPMGDAVTAFVFTTSYRFAAPDRSAVPYGLVGIGAEGATGCNFRKTRGDLAAGIEIPATPSAILAFELRLSRYWAAGTTCRVDTDPPTTLEPPEPASDIAGRFSLSIGF